MKLQPLFSVASPPPPLLPMVTPDKGPSHLNFLIPGLIVMSKTRLLVIIHTFFTQDGFWMRYLMCKVILTKLTEVSILLKLEVLNCASNRAYGGLMDTYPCQFYQRSRRKSAQYETLWNNKTGNSRVLRTQLDLSAQVLPFLDTLGRVFLTHATSLVHLLNSWAESTAWTTLWNGKLGWLQCLWSNYH